MDQARFDRIARALGATATRRTGIAAAIAGALGIAAAQPAPAKKKKKKCKPKCTNGYSCKKKQCVCKSGVLCDGACCAAGQFCDAGNACAPIPTDCTVCASGCPYSTIGAALANDRGATITVAPGTYEESDLAIERDVTIAACAEGAGDPNVIVDAAGAGRVFTVGFDRIVTLRGLTIVGGRSAMAGGCISNFSTLTLERCIVSACESTNAGGAISSAADSSLTLDATRVSGNFTDDRSFGGGIVAAGDLRVVNGSRVDANQSGFTGGGIYFSGKTLLIEDSSVNGNLLVAPESLGGGVYVADGTATLDAATVTGNEAEAGAGVFVAADAKLELRGGTRISGNEGQAGSSGQGVRLADKATVSCNAGPLVCGNPISGATLATNCFDASGAAFPANCGCAAGACPA